MGGMIVQFRAKLKMISEIFDHDIINEKKDGLVFQMSRNCSYCL